jgi:luciferase family oxidoreductase group 1
MGNPLKLGILDQSPVRNGGTAADAVRETLELARMGDRLGFFRFWLAEHHSTNSFAGAAPEVLIPAVAGATSRIRVGSGGVMLSHYSPLKVAEQFRMLELLHPGRIDLGIGRAPGGDHLASRALRYGREEIGIGRFPEQVADLVRWVSDTMEDDHPYRRVRAMPRAPSVPEVWLLGSGGESAGYAAEHGCGFSFAQFISGLDAAAQVAEYRARFRPSRMLAEPRASVAIGVICAESRAEAERLALSMHLWRWNVIRRTDRGIPSPEQAEEAFGEAGVDLRDLTDDSRSIVGDPGMVRDGLLRLAEHTGVDEIMTVTVTHSWEARRRSYELVADVLGLESGARHAEADTGPVGSAI